MSYSSKEIVDKLKEWGELIDFKATSEYRVRFPSIRRIIAYVDCVWFTKHPVEVPVIGFEISMRGVEFMNSKKMKGDIMNLKALNPRLGILAVNEKEAQTAVETWYQGVEAYKEVLKALASPIPLRIIDTNDIITEKVLWRTLLSEIGLKLIQ